MIRSMIVLTLALATSGQISRAGQVSTEDFETGFRSGAPLRTHGDWFFAEQNAEPTSQENVGLAKSWGIGPGDRAFTWSSKPFSWSDPKLVSVTMGGDWQTDAAGNLDDDRAGWSISDEDDSSDNIFGVQIDPGPVTAPSGGVEVFGFRLGGEDPPEPGLNIETYWDGDTSGDDGGRAQIIELPKLEPETWYRLRAKFTKLTSTSAKIEVTFVQLDKSGSPAGKVHAGVLEDTSKLPDDEGRAKPNEAYFAAPTTWPVFKNFSVAEGGFDNAHFEIERSDD